MSPVDDSNASPLASVAAAGQTPDTSLPPIEDVPEREKSLEALIKALAPLDLFQAGLVLILAFFVASFAVRNSDFWLHLASGRLLATGQYTFGKDSFSFTTENSYWANNAWLSDLLLYLTTNAAGGVDSPTAGTILVILKAALIALLAFVLLRIRLLGATLWPGVFCVGIALLALSPGLPFQPALISYLFLGLTLYLLQQPERLPPGPGQFRSYWCLPVLFLFWVNMDFWFFLGPVTVGLYLLGKLLQQAIPLGTPREESAGRALGTLAAALVVGLAACLLNPHHIHAFHLPAALSMDAPKEVLQGDRHFRGSFTSILQDEYWQAAGNQTIAGRMYFVLVALGIVSFILAFLKEAPWPRLLIWLAFLALSILYVRMISFFAVVAGPIAALNLQAFSLHTAAPAAGERARAWRLLLVGGRIATLLALIVGLAYVWPGWHRGMARESRQDYRVAWAVPPNTSLRQVAEVLGQWRKQGLIAPDEHAFHYVPDTANYAAWYAGSESEKGMFDYRYTLYTPEVATDYINLRRAFRDYPFLTADDSGEPINRDSLLRKYQIRYVVLNMMDLSSRDVWQRLLADWYTWELVYMDGRSFVFHWNDWHRPKAPGKHAGPPRLEPDAMVFEGKTDLVAPAMGPARRPQPADPLVRYAKGPPVLPLQGDLAHFYLLYHHQLSQTRLNWLIPAVAASELTSWTNVMEALGSSPAAGLVLAPAVYSFVTSRQTAIIDSMVTQKKAIPIEIASFDLDYDDGSPGALILAIRAARQAIDENPDDALAYTVLADAYDNLWRLEDRNAPRSFDPSQMSVRQHLRLSQMVTSLEFGLQLVPQNFESHKKLADVYARTNNLDVALEHLTAAVKYQGENGPLPGEESGEFRERMDRLQKQHKDLESAVKYQQDRYEVDAANKPPMEKVQRALMHGLGKKAIDLLLGMNPETLGKDEIALLIELLLQMGRPDDALDVLRPEWKAAFGGTYSTMKLRACAALGQYEEASKLLEELTTMADLQNQQFAVTQLSRQVFQGLGGRQLENLNLMNILVQNYRRAAELHVTRGVLALEQGDRKTARGEFTTALDPAKIQKMYFDGKGAAMRYLHLLNEAQHN